MITASIPSPGQGTWQIGFFELRAYALCIIAGVLVAVWIGNRRWVARGGQPGTVADIAVWAVPFGLVGARLYHVITDYQLYFGEGRHPIEALYVWRGGLGIWGAVALGALGAYIGCRRRRIKFMAFADAVAPAIAVAQGIGRFGNWFNQELFGRPTTLPWALQIDPQFRPNGYEQFATFHPTFLYESLWDFGVAGLVIWADRRFRLGYGRAFALYVMAYTAGRGWIEYLRIDEANHILGLRLNDWTSMVVFVAALTFFIWSARRRSGREEDVEPVPVPKPVEPIRSDAAGAADTADTDDPDDPDDDARDTEATDEEKVQARAAPDDRGSPDDQKAPLPAGAEREASTANAGVGDTGAGDTGAGDAGAAKPRRRWLPGRRSKS